MTEGLLWGLRRNVPYLRTTPRTLAEVHRHMQRQISAYYDR